ncbi:hypothetical protein [Modicisalibacter luteus]|uniref:Uncharacterized protein n=1 Tax=Modicisalibacter luteus TaxID=453962 RepID=A0ABV7LZS0_9GAMM|nr:hypothetical protein [Halomonas lutea]GHB00938.1 hypothetical protein GCM10007159_23320 [Halomonas lutea]
MKKSRAGRILERYEALSAKREGQAAEREGWDTASEESSTRIGKLLQHLNSDDLERTSAGRSGWEGKFHVIDQTEAERFRQQQVQPANEARRNKKQARIDAIKQAVMHFWTEKPAIRAASPREARSMLVRFCQMAGVEFSINANRDMSEATQELAAEGILPRSFGKPRQK